MRRLALALVVAAMGCGDDGGNNRADAGPGDDAGDLDADPSTPVTMTVKLNGAAVAGVRVHFQNPDSSVITSVDTDATGVASAMMPEGGFVTAVDPFTPAPGAGARHDLFTYANVQPGDELEVTEKDAPTSAGSVTVNAATDAAGTVDGYVFWSPCYQGDVEANPTVVMTLESNCTPTTDIVVASVDTAGEIVHWVYAQAVSTAATVNLTASAFTSTPIDRTYTLNNLVGYGQSFGTLQLWSTAGRIIEATFGDLEVTTLSEPYKLPNYTNAVEVLQAQDETEFSYHITADWGPLVAGELIVDMGARHLKTATTGTSFDASMKRVTWSEDTTGAVADFAESEMEISRNSGALYIYWRVLAPNNPGVVSYPTLPVEATDYNPGNGDVVDAKVFLGKVPGGFAAVRENYFTVESPTDIATLSASGQLVVQEIYPAGGGLQRMKKARTAPTRKSLVGAKR